jgi:hypothetical protein
MIINDYAELCKMIGCVDDFAAAINAIYKSTNCGASLQKIENGVKIGSIVEGCATDTKYYDFTFPFNMNEFWETITLIEKEAVVIWNEHVAVEEMIKWEESHKYCPEDM